MSNRNVITRQREALTGVDAELDAVRRVARSPAAQAHLGRAQSLVRGARLMIDYALRTELDPVIDVTPLRRDATAASTAR